MKKLISLILSAVIAVNALTVTANAKDTEKTTPSGIAYENIHTEIDEYITEYEKGLASAEVAVFDRDGTIFTGYYGYSDIENNIPADENTVYEWGSVSKLLVWTSVMQLWEQGKIDFETDIREYLPEGFLKKLQYENETITMENLMSHNAGWQESFYENQEATEEELDESLEAALHRCETYQAYHVGEYTAYSNWGTALAAYIVECISGEDYVDYVHKHIFEPLEMEHTCLDPHRSDNEWVRDKREELKCYYRGAEEKYNEDYGVCNSWGQLYPAGTAISTLEDLTTFAQAFVTEKCPLFEKEETRELMFTATSYYGDSDIAKNCHGFWTSEYAVQTIGHAGNTNGCTANLVFDPESGLGVVVLVNEPGEGMFSYGIPSLLFGDVRDSERLKNAVITEEKEISGVYTPKRVLPEGALNSMSYVGGFMPWKSADNANEYKMSITGISFGEGTLTRIADNQYLWEDNGMRIFMYESTDSLGNIRLEMISSDYVETKHFGVCALVIILFWFIGIVSIILLIIKLMKKILKKRKSYTKEEKSILLQQLIYAPSGIIHICFVTGIAGGVCTFGKAAFSGIMVGIMAVVSLANSIFLWYNTAKVKNMKKSSVVKQYLWVVLGMFYFVFIIVFQLYNFWNL